MSEKSQEILGGAFGVIAILAAIVEYIMRENGDVVAIASCIKDLAGTAMVVIVFIAVLSSLPKKPKDIDSLLNLKLKEYVDTHSNMLLFDEVNKRDIFIRTDVANFFSGGNSGGRNGRFVLLPDEGHKSEFSMTFSLNLSLFVGKGDVKVEAADRAKILEQYAEQISNYARTKYNEIAVIKVEKSKSNIVVTLKEYPASAEDVDTIIAIINTMYQAFLVDASTKA